MHGCDRSDYTRNKLGLSQRRRRKMKVMRLIPALEKTIGINEVAMEHFQNQISM
jgi:hypothetical protein